MDGWRYLVTVSEDVTRCLVDRGADIHRENGFWGPFQLAMLTEALAHHYRIRIPLIRVIPVYEYREGEPWAGYVRGVLICGSSVAYTGNAEALFHRRVTNVCDSTKQFRQFFRALKEASDHE